MPSWKKVAVSGSDASFNSLYVTNAVTASIFSGSFIGDGAGLTNLTYGDFATASFTSQATWSFAHNIGYQYVAIEVFDQNNFIVIPSAIKIIDSNNVDIYFTSPQSGTALATLGTGVVTTSGGTANTSSLLVTASAANNVITFTKGNGSTFNVTVDTGSVNLTGYTTTSSFNAFTSSYNTGSFTGSFIGDGSQLTGIVSSKWTGSNPISRQSDVEITGSLRVTGGVTASLFGTASWANNALTASYVQNASTASYVILAQTASYVENAQTASYVLQAVSASFATLAQTATTASYILNAVSASFATTSSFAISASWAPSSPAFPFTGSALITGSLGVTGSLSTLAQGASPTDIAFRVRNSADTANLIESRGNGHLIVANSNFADVFTAQNSLESFRMGGGNLNYVRATQSGNLQYIIRNGASSNALITLTAGPANQVYWENLFDFDTVSKNVTIFGGSSIARGNSGDSVMWVRSGTSTPSSNFADMFGLYSADRNGVAGKASPHFRTEDGTVLWLGDESRLFNVTASRTIISSSQNTISGSSLTVYGSGSAQPVFTVQGSSGELFSVTDSLTGSLFSVNDISGLPILEVFSDNTTLIGNYLDPMLITTAKVTQTNSGSFTVYSLPTASYDTAFFEYSVRSGSNARAGTIMAIQSGSSVNFTETTTTDFGNTTAVSFVVIVTGSNMALTGSSTSGAWTIKSIVRGL